MSKRRSDSYSAGERGEDRARAERKNVVTSKLSKADVLVQQKIPEIGDAARAAVRRLVHANARDDVDREQLLDQLGIGEVAG